jgi:preprotein translocase subunit SecY
MDATLLRSLQPYFERIPTVKRPGKHIPFREKFMWTVVVLVLYFVLSNVPLFGLSPDSIDLFEQYRAFFAGQSGSIIALGIGPIVTASIILQLLVGAGVIRLDLSKPEDQRLFQDTQKFLVFVMIIVESLPQVLGGFMNPDPKLAASLGVSLNVITLMLILQLIVGGILILYMDEVVSKWGIGSGVSLFIVAGISQALITGLFNWKPDMQNIPIGIIPRWVWIAQNMDAAQLLSAPGLRFLLINGGVLALISTALIFIIVVYAESTRVEVPLSHALVRGARGRFPIKLIYASVLPMIFVRALQANVQMMGLILARKGITIFGEFEGNRPVSGLMYYLSPLRGPFDWIPSLVRETHPDIAIWQIGVHVTLDALILVIGGIIFAVFWTETSGMGPRAVARQVQSSGMQIPGFRRDPAVLERFFKRYIPKVTVIGGAIIGLLTLIASLLGTIGQTSGTGLLLTVSIMYRLYEDLAKEQAMEMHPMVRKFLGAE